MSWYRQFLQRFGFTGVMLTLLTVAYLVLFMMLGLMGEGGFGVFYSQISLPVHLETAIRQPWSLFTYWLAAHPTQFWFLFLDLVVLYAFGHLLNTMVGNLRTQGIIVLAIVVNAMLTIALSNLLPTVESNAETRMSGFSAVNATLVAATITLVPRYSFRILFWDVPLVYIGLFMLAASIVSLRAVFTVAGTAEIVGAGIGFLMIKYLRSGWDVTRWLQGTAQRPQPQIPRPPEMVYSDQRKVVVRAIHPQQRPASVQPSPQTGKNEAEELDDLLDKINEVGYSGLTKQEKERLDALSKQ
ncbi:MAG: hypothetical protein RLZZ165_1293 [Bacteroidota bacterium]|jgi:hypothetical protein